MKIATVGKGGSGKTTVAGTLARVLAEQGCKVLAIDGDPNPNLALTLGIDRADAEHIRNIPPSVVESREESDGTRKLHMTLSHRDLLDQYAAPGGKSVQAAIARHCRELAKEYKAAAEANRQLAAEHKKLAKSAAK